MFRWFHMSPVTARNIVIILALGALVDVIPGGGTGASIAFQAVYLVFLAALVWFAVMMYRQHRTSLYSLGERRRVLVYVAVAVAVVVLTGTTRMWHSSSIGQVVWLVLLGGAVYAVAAVWWSARKY